MQELMKNFIYIAGPITDYTTGLPRANWQQDFRKAEEKLKGLGFDVISPIDVAADAEEDWSDLLRTQNGRLLVDRLDGDPATAPRWFYLRKCINRLSQLHGFGKKTGAFGVEGTQRLFGVYVIGDLIDIQRSYGTMCEINFALAAGLTVWSQYHHGYAIDNLLRQDLLKHTLAETANQYNQHPLI